MAGSPALMGPRALHPMPQTRQVLVLHRASILHSVALSLCLSTNVKARQPRMAGSLARTGHRAPHPMPPMHQVLCLATLT